MDKPEQAVTPFYRQSPAQRRQTLVTQQQLPPQLAEGVPALSIAAADQMVENVIGVFALPLAVSLHMVVDKVARLVPLVVEEASIVAALSAAAKLAKQAGGFFTEAPESLLIGQVQLLDIADIDAGSAQLQAAEDTLLARANALVPSLVRRGGGVRALQVRRCQVADKPDFLVVHLLVDTCDAMGANLVNTLCEAMAPTLAKVAGGRAHLRILSNLTDRALVTARVSLPLAVLAAGDVEAGKQVRDGIIAASDFASACPYRAATHNKGIMNGIDAVAIATGNDWRAIEANAHAWAGRADGYQPLSRWFEGADGALQGYLQLPLKVGTRGGNFAVNPTVAAAQALLATDDARTLARIMAAVGLAQNFAALRALSGDGIQRGHMALHARSVAASAGVPTRFFEAVVAAMVAEKEVKVHRAQALLAQMLQSEQAQAQSTAAATAAHLQPTAADKPTGETGHGEGAGKVLLFGEHAVVYGAHAVALPLAVATRASVTPMAAGGVHLRIPAWQVDARLADEPEVGGVHHSLHIILAKLGLLRRHMHILVDAQVPRAMGLGSSAALAVAVVQALSAAFALHLNETQVIALAFEAEKVAHATPSGVDNALATVRRPLLFRRGEPALMQPLQIAKPLHLLLGLSGEQSLTATTVRRVRAARDVYPTLYDDIFKRIDALSLSGQQALASGEWPLLGKLMNINHGLLHALDLCTPAIEDVVLRARAAGALGAKMTGGGGGGSVVALCEGEAGTTRVGAALHAAGYQTTAFVVPATRAGEDVSNKESSHAC